MKSDTKCNIKKKKCEDTITIKNSEKYECDHKFVQMYLKCKIIKI